MMTLHVHHMSAGESGMRISLEGVAAGAALALVGILCAQGEAQAGGPSLEPGICRESAPNPYGCARISGYVAARADAAAQANTPLAFPPLRAPASRSALAPRQAGYGFDARFLIDASHDTSFR